MSHATNYFRVDLEVIPFDDRDPAATARARATADELAAEHGAPACLYRLPLVPGPWSRYPLVGAGIGEGHFDHPRREPAPKSASALAETRARTAAMRAHDAAVERQLAAAREREAAR